MDDNVSAFFFYKTRIEFQKFTIVIISCVFSIAQRFPAGYFEILEAENLSTKYGIPYAICKLVIDAEYNDENVTEEARVERARFLMRVLELFDRIRNHWSNAIKSNHIWCKKIEL